MIKTYLYKDNLEIKDSVEAVKFVDSSSIRRSLYKLLEDPLTTISLTEKGLFVDVGYQDTEVTIGDYIVRHSGGKITVVPEIIFDKFFKEKLYGDDND